MPLSLFFSCPPAVPLLLRPRPHRPLHHHRTRRPPAATTRPSAPPPDAPLTPPPATPLLRHPSSVIAAPAATLHLLLAHLSSSFTRTLAFLSTRARHRHAARRAAARLAARHRRLVFLRSAVAASTATLANTRAFLAAQRARADAADAHLAVLAVDRAHMEAAVADVRRRRAVLADAEAALATERRGVKGVGKRLLLLEEEVRRAKVGLAEGEGKVEQERERLEEEKGKQETLLADVRGETARLATVLVETEKKLKREVAERDAFVNVMAGKERELGIVNEKFDNAVSHLEDRRRQIEDINEETRKVARMAQKKRAGLDAVVQGEVAVQDIQSSLGRIQRQQQVIRNSLTRLTAEHKAKESENEKLLCQLTERDEKLRQLRVRLKNSQASLKTSAASSQKRFASAADSPALKNSAILSDADVSSSGTINKQQASSYSPVASEQSSHPETSGTVRVSDSPTAVSPTLESPPCAHPVVDTAAAVDATSRVASNASETDLPLEREPKPIDLAKQIPTTRRRRGRPRKCEQAVPVLEETPKPKRGRGRPRKVATAPEALQSIPPKRKRGRPRKFAAIPTIPPYTSSG